MNNAFLKSNLFFNTTLGKIIKINMKFIPLFSYLFLFRLNDCLIISTELQTMNIHKNRDFSSWPSKPASVFQHYLVGLFFVDLNGRRVKLHPNAEVNVL